MTAPRLLDQWSPPDGAGAPIACLATTFTFEADFFAQDCLARFLSLSTVKGEGDRISSVAAVLEEEERLSDTTICVLIDRSSPAEKRNLRWDVLPIHPPGGLLHAKVAVLLWERSARILLGSANLTSAGYRRQVETLLAIDIAKGCGVARPVIEDLLRELRLLVALAPPAAAGARSRAMTTLDQVATRLDELDLPRKGDRDLRLAMAPARPGTSPLSSIADVWHGPQPLRATMLSPYWDDHAPAPALEAVWSRLTGRPSTRRRLTLVAAVDPFSGNFQAPPSLQRKGADILAFDPPDEELRSLHAKVLLVESDEWLAAMIGSSNATRSGFGLHPVQGHHELNVWVGCPAKSATAKHLRSLIPLGARLDVDDERWDPAADDDEPTVPVLPMGFGTLVLNARAPASVRLDVDRKCIPEAWKVSTPGGHVLLTAEDWRARGSADSLVIDLPDEVLPSYLIVLWLEQGEQVQATWTANVEDRSQLPLPAELAELPVDVLLAALASTRPLPIALEAELRRRAGTAGERDCSVDLDLLRRFDESGLLFHRTRRLSLALWRLQGRLSRPANSLDAVHWRLHGVFGPIALAEGFVKAALDEQTLPGEAHFFLAELALTVADVNWKAVAQGIDERSVRKLVADALKTMAERRHRLPAAMDPAIDSYLSDAFAKARR